MFCTNCGAKLPKDARFCSSCGKAIVSISGEEQVETERNSTTETGQPITQIAHQLLDEDRPAGTEQQVIEEEEELLRLFIGPSKEDYYMTKWKKRNSWNWAAFFFSIYWMTYRKMYGYTFVLLGFFIAFYTLTTLFDVEISVSAGISVAYIVVFGLCSNKLYEQFAKKKIKQIKGTYPPTENIAAIVVQKGGTSLKSVFAVMAIYVVISIVTVYIPTLSMLKDEPVIANEQPADNENESAATINEEQIKIDVTNVIHANIDALRNEDASAYMDTIYYDEVSPDLYFQTEEVTHQLFGDYDIAYTIDGIEFVTIRADEVTVRIQQTSVKVSGMAYSDNTAIALNTFKKQEGMWKFYRTEVEDIQYSNEGNASSYDDQVSYNAEAYAIYEQNCMDCHGIELAGGYAAPSLDTIGAKYTPPNLQDIIQYGSGLMPAQSQLTEGELTILVEWLSGME
ncbi:DUF2628 domain-containing protein [Ornithinibacillus contaminans]|uniref:DUF2628 domain-containing protein n=1 Tax=Ornithinibacillus contaminans TaxID=694055 RepID=UPI00064DB73C|nr:c-type cytochrome [Ornithinibacillus contaminans]